MSKKEKVLIKNYFEYLTSYYCYTPDELTEVVRKMEKDGISHCEICSEYESVVFRYYRLETEEEQTDRLARLAKERAFYKKMREERFIKEAAELGYSIKPLSEFREELGLQRLQEQVDRFPDLRTPEPE